MNTILTDDEIHKWWASENGMEDADLARLADFRDVIRKAEAAVLAKLREQEPLTNAQAEIILGHGLDNLSESDTKRLMAKAQDRLDRLMESRALYAAPQPAVVPPGYKLVPVELLEKAAGAINWHLEPSSPDEHEQIWLELCALAAAPEAPAPAGVQVPQGEYQRNVMSSLANWLETRSHTVWAQEGGHDGLMQIYAADLRAMLAAVTEAPALPAEVREAIKVAREALGKVDTACRLIPEDLEGYLEPLSDALSDARAAIARIDALGGGE